MYERQGLGVGCLRKLFGKSNRSRGARPEHHCKAAGGVIRHILIQLESCGLVEKMDEDQGGRKISSAVCFCWLRFHMPFHAHNLTQGSLTIATVVANLLHSSGMAAHSAVQRDGNDVAKHGTSVANVLWFPNCFFFGRHASYSV